MLAKTVAKKGRPTYKSRISAVAEGKTVAACHVFAISVIVCQPSYSVCHPLAGTEGFEPLITGPGILPLGDSPSFDGCC